MPERIDLTRADDLRDVVHKAVACLAQGGLVAWPTEATYEIVASALKPEPLARLRGIIDFAPPHPGTRPTLLLRSSGEIDDWVEVPSEVGRRLARRAWPGPLRLVLTARPGGLTERLAPEVREYLCPDGRLAVRSPSHRLAREILRLVSGPLVQVETGSVAPGRIATADDLAGLPGLEMLLDAGPTRFSGPSTVVEVIEEGWRIVTPGAVPEAAIAEMAGTIFLFICTGNTCRSPMAEALCKAIIARRIGCEVGGLVDRGYVVISAGVSAMDGMPAARNAIEVVRSRGGSLVDHASRKASPELIRLADHVIAMTADHLEVLLDRVPEAAPRSRLLDPSGEDVADPVGYDRQVYHETATSIEDFLNRFLDEIGVQA